ncbi:MAG: DUF421 domain-containing protein [Clostridia bacterium]|nr:DUF421 domain-containing protein [Clostridia bacterium]
MYTLVGKTVIIYLFLLVAVRLMGKRQLGDLELSEFVVTIMLSELAVLPLANKNVSLWHAIGHILVLIFLESFVSYLSLKNRKIKKLVGGAPSILINKGRLDKKEMTRLRFGLDELMSQLRQKDIYDISDVEYAILEENGQMSVIPKMGSRSVSLDDMGIKKEEKGMVHVLIADGELSEFNLSLTGHSHRWLKTQLKKNGCKMKDVFLMTVDDCDNVKIIK